LPSVDEWYKAAYYDPARAVYYDYPTGSDIAPDGIDFPGDSAFDAVFNDGGENAAPNDITDVGVLSPFGTAGQGGNVFEWEETSADLLNDRASTSHGNRGGRWGLGSEFLLASQRNTSPEKSPFTRAIGIRIVKVTPVPEPTSLLVILNAAVSMVIMRRLRLHPSTVRACTKYAGPLGRYEIGILHKDLPDRQPLRLIPDLPLPPQ